MVDWRIESTSYILLHFTEFSKPWSPGNYYRVNGFPADPPQVTEMVISGWNPETKFDAIENPQHSY